MKAVDFNKLLSYARMFSGYTAEREALLAEVHGDLQPRLGEVTDHFYATLEQIPEAVRFIEGRVEQLKNTHLQWLEQVLRGPCDATYTESMYRVGEVHVKVALPVEFMAGGICLIQDGLIRLIADVYRNDPKHIVATAEAVNAALGFSLMVMQESYQASSLAEELERFLAITGMSRVLFENLAQAYKP